MVQAFESVSWNLKNSAGKLCLRFHSNLGGSVASMHSHGCQQLMFAGNYVGELIGQGISAKIRDSRQRVLVDLVLLASVN